MDRRGLRYVALMWPALLVGAASGCRIHECPDAEGPPDLDCRFWPEDAELGGEPTLDSSVQADGQTVVIEYAREDGTRMRVTYEVSSP